MLAFTMMAASPLRAQEEKDSAGNNLDARQAVATILLSGLIGGILGLSTLSFYKNPQDNIRNITWGAAIGMLASIAVLSVNATVNPVSIEDGKNEARFMISPIAPLDFGAPSSGLTYAPLGPTPAGVWGLQASLKF